MRPELPSLRALVPKSAVGWMNMRTARIPGERSGADSEEAQYLTLGAGARAAAGPWARENNSVSLERLKRENLRLDHPVQIGALGESLKGAGKTTAVLGALDGALVRREAALIAIDASGRVNFDRMDTQFWMEADPNEPYGIASSTRLYTTLLDAAAWPKRPDFTVWVFGDIERAAEYASLCLPQQAARMRKDALDRLNTLLNVAQIDPNYGPEGQLERDRRSMLLLLAPPIAARGSSRLGAIALSGDGVQPGIITSGSTKCSALVTNTDFLPTITYSLGLKTPAGMIGRPMTVTGSAVSVDEWAGMHTRWKIRSDQQSALGGFPTGQMLVVVCTFGIGFGLRKRVFPTPFQNGFERLSHALPLAVLALPILGLLLPAVNPGPVWVACLWLAAVTAGLVVLGMWKPATIGEIATGLLAALVLVLASDLPTGQRLLKQAWMSYSVMEGARYYGIGNEYSGALITVSMLIAVRLLCGKRERFWPAALAGLGVIAALIGLPGAGANAGCFLGAAFGFGVAGIVWWKGRIRPRDFLALAMLVVILLAAALALDLARGTENQSHIARAISYGGSISNIVWRKLLLNAHLLLHSPWPLSLIAAAFGLWAQWRRPDSPLRALVTNDRIVRGSALGILAATIAIFLVNDSGVVAAAESLLVAWAGAMALTVRACTAPTSGESQA